MVMASIRRIAKSHCLESKMIGSVICYFVSNLGLDHYITNTVYPSTFLPKMAFSIVVEITRNERLLVLDYLHIAQRVELDA